MKLIRAFSMGVSNTNLVLSYPCAIKGLLVDIYVNLMKRLGGRCNAFGSLVLEEKQGLED